MTTLISSLPLFVLSSALFGLSAPANPPLEGADPTPVMGAKKWTPYGVVKIGDKYHANIEKGGEVEEIGAYDTKKEAKDAMVEECDERNGK